MLREALILFVRKPELGKVKTRIAQTQGNETALRVYQKLVQHTHAITAPLACDTYVFYAGGIVKNDIWNDCQKLPQPEGALGERMHYAFTYLFGRAYNNICIIGSDCYELTTEIIEEAFNQLHTYDVVIGPAYDGGYYLLGMRGGVKSVFEGIEWSTGKVLEQTISKLDEQQHSYTLLTRLHDVDTIEDVPLEWRND